MQKNTGQTRQIKTEDVKHGKFKLPGNLLYATLTALEYLRYDRIRKSRSSMYAADQASQKVYRTITTECFKGTK